MNLIEIIGIISFVLAIITGIIISINLSKKRIALFNIKQLEELIVKSKKLKKKCMISIVGILIFAAIPVVLISNQLFRDIYLSAVIIFIMVCMSGLIYSFRAISIASKEITDKNQSNG